MKNGRRKQMKKTESGKRHRRIAGEYCAGAAVTNFPTKYFHIELCVEILL